MVDPSSDRVSRAPPYSYSRFEDFGFRLRGCHALRPDFPVGSATLVFLTLPGGLLPFRSPLLRESRLISFPGLLRWFTSPSVAPPPYFIQVRGAGITPGGLPHSDIRGSRDMCSSPGFSQLVASFIACQLQGIRHGPVFAWPYGLFTLHFRCFYLHSFPVHFKHPGLRPHGLLPSTGTD